MVNYITVYPFRKLPQSTLCGALGSITNPATPQKNHIWTTNKNWHHFSISLAKTKIQNGKLRNTNTLGRNDFETRMAIPLCNPYKCRTFWLNIQYPNISPFSVSHLFEFRKIEKSKSRKVYFLTFHFLTFWNLSDVFPVEHAQLFFPA